MKDAKGLETSHKHLFFCHLQSGVHKNSEGLAILILNLMTSWRKHFISWDSTKQHDS